MGRTLYLLIFCLASPLAQASVLTDDLTNLFTSRLNGVADKVAVTVKTPVNQLPPCEQPQLQLAPNSRLWGNVNVQARCGNAMRYIQVVVAASGHYVVARGPIVRGAQLNQSNVTTQYGRLDKLPARAILDISQAQNSIALRDIAPAQPLQPYMLRQSWTVKAGQQVQVIASGDGFSVNSEGQALNNAAVSQAARVRLASGQIVSGKVNADGNILIGL